MVLFFFIFLGPPSLNDRDPRLVGAGVTIIGIYRNENKKPLQSNASPDIIGTD